ncbi:uncharacterized protein BX664DRAFT_289595 [Halteromyces radiatus]|uniref:uncharacterized protein n=1 Tax=Halteromyces radiatus TaxID=101107 RepID=UPI0022201D23|nr:uncharacterized protein BX664DRAFT_289595 [Halteromyces radiatus]KAI8099483.1 hypothetical protein BX664DRAFT_289595 [Halteromyces radiatus]
MQPHVILLILLLSLWTYHCYAASQCLSLNTSLVCSAFQGYSVDIWTGPIWIRNSTTIENVDTRLDAYSKQQQWPKEMPWCLSTTTKVMTTATPAPYPRYANTILCAQLIQESPACNPAPSSPVLCDDTCTGFIKSINTSFCPTVNQTSFNQHCQSGSSSSSNYISGNSICIKGDINEIQYCGWKKKSDVCASCQVNQEDPCCTTMLSKCPTFEQSRQVIGAILGSVIACFIILGCGFYGWYRKANKKNDGDDETKVDNKSSGLVQHLSMDGNTSESTLIGRYSIESDKKHEYNNNDSDDEQPLSYTLAKRHEDDHCFYEAIYVNVPRRPFDIVLNKGDLIHLHCYTDEDWGIGYNLTTGQQGSFPMICIRTLTLDQAWKRIDEQPLEKQQMILKHRVCYFISSNEQELDYNGDDDDGNDDDDDDDDETTSPTTPPIHNNMIITKK